MPVARWRRALGRRWPALLALSVFAVALWAQGEVLVGVFFDDGVYVGLAKSLAEGDGYRNPHLPSAPWGIHYPPLYPLVLSLLWRLWPAFPANVALFQLLDAAALATAAYLMALHARRWGVPRWATAVGLPIGFVAYPLLTIVGVRFSEPLFLALAAGTVCIADRETVPTRRAVLGGILAGLAALTRTVGVTLIGGVVIALLVRGRRGPAAVAGAAGAAVVAPWFGWIWWQRGAVDERLAANYGTYFMEAGQAGVAGVLGVPNLAVLAPFAELVLPSAPGWIWVPLALVLGGIVVVGALRVARRVPALIAWLALYVPMVALWPYPSERFVWVLLPWLCSLAVVGGWSLWGRGLPARVLVGAVAVSALVGYLPREVDSLLRRGFGATAEGISRTFGPVVRSIAAETPDSAIVASADEALIHLYTGRRAVPGYLFRWRGRATEALSPDATIAFYCEVGVTHLVLDGPGSLMEPVVRELRAREPPAAPPVFALRGGPALYEFRCPG